jgi:hypothetical protein
MRQPPRRRPLLNNWEVALVAAVIGLCLLAAAYWLGR